MCDRILLLINIVNKKKELGKRYLKFFCLEFFSLNLNVFKSFV